MNTNHLSIDEQNLLYRELPKWPQHYITGRSVTIEQAKEIIRRTDYFFRSPTSGGNDSKFDHHWHEQFGMLSGENYWDKPAGSENPYDAPHHIWARTADQYHKVWGFLDVQYVTNDWISTCFTHGPHGFVHPTGEIGFVDNIGKYPAITEVFADWLNVAKAFPFLDLGATLMSAESADDDKIPVVSFRIQNGEVRPIDPAVMDVHQNHPKPPVRISKNRFDSSYSRKEEHGLPESWLREYAEHARRIKKLFVLT